MKTNYLAYFRPVVLLAWLLLFVLGPPSLSGSELKFDLTKDQVRWGEPITLKIESSNPYFKTIQGGMTVSFSSNVFILSLDEGIGNIYYENDRVMKVGHKETVPVRDIMVENWYRWWRPGEWKEMTVTFLPLRIGSLRITLRAAFERSRREHDVISVPASSSCRDQQGYPAYCRNIFVEEAPNLIANLRLIMNMVDHDDKELVRNLQVLISNPRNKGALAYFGIDGFDSSAQFYERYLEALRIKVADPRIRNSPYFMKYLKRLINDPSDTEALKFFGILVQRREEDPQVRMREQYENSCRKYLTNQPGGSALLSLITSENDIHFGYSGDEGVIVLVYLGREHRFRRGSPRQGRNCVVTMIDGIMKFKPNSRFIYEGEPVSGYSYRSLRAKIR